MSRRLAVWLALVVVFVACIVAAAGSAESGGSAADSSLTRQGIDYDGTEIQDGDGPSVAVVPIRGVMTSGDSSADGGSTGSADIVRMLDAIGASGDFDGVLLELDTPGGGVSAAEEIHDAIRRLQRKDVHVVAWMRDVTASAGYYVSAPAERIIASPTTMTGSIGVILEYQEVGGLADKLGVRSVVIKSGELKDIGSPFRQITPKERGVLQGVIDEAFDQFVGVVAKGRDLPEARVRELADGRIYTGRQARRKGLVDELGLRRDAYDAMAEVIGDDDADDGGDLDVVEFSRRYGLLDTLTAGAQPTLDGMAAARAIGAVVSGTGSVRATGTTPAAHTGNGFAKLEYRAEL